MKNTDQVAEDAVLRIIEALRKRLLEVGDIETSLQHGFETETLRSLENIVAQELSQYVLSFEIIDAIIEERDYQDKKWGSIHNHPHTPFEWVGIMEKKVADAKKAYFQRPATELMLAEILQAVAVGIAMLQQHGVETRHTLERFVDRDEDG